MAHMVETMAYANEVPWHGLGIKVPGDLSPQQMLEKAGLNWTVSKRPLFMHDNQGVELPTSAFALCRDSDDKVLSIISESWNPVQNHAAFEFFHDFVAAGDMNMETAGSLRDGKMVWGLAKINDGFTVFGDDRVEGYLLFSNPHEFGKSIDVRFTPIRVVCNNTLTLSLHQTTKYSVKVNHRSTFDADRVKETLGICKDQLSRYKEQAEFLGSKRYSTETVKEYMKRVFPTTDILNEDLSKNAELALETLDTQPGHRFAPGTWWNAFNAVTYLADHKLGRSTNTRLESAWYGQNRIRKEKALGLAVEYAEVA